MTYPASFDLVLFVEIKKLTQQVASETKGKHI